MTASEYLEPHPYRQMRRVLPLMVPAPRWCLTYVSPSLGSVSGWSTDRCLECGGSWYHHRNIGPGWRERSEQAKVQRGDPPYDKIVLGET